MVFVYGVHSHAATVVENGAVARHGKDTLKTANSAIQLYLLCA